MLRETSDRRTLAFVATYFVLLFTAMLAPLSHWAQWVALGACLAVMAFICAVITHNTVHHPVFREKRWNRAFQIVLTLAYGHPVSAYVPGHNLSHHVHTQTAKDSIRTSKLRFRWNLLNQLLFLPVVAPAIMKGERDYLKRMKSERPGWFRQWSLEMAIFATATIALFVFDWQRALAFWLIPHFYAVWGIVGINFAQHDGCDDEHEYNHSRNFTGGFANWLLFNNGYHAIHHDKPNLHWSALPETHARLIAPNNHDALDQKNMAAYFWRAYIWPGRRLRFDGTPLVLPARMEDEDWIPKSSRHPDGVSMGVEA